MVANHANTCTQCGAEFETGQRWVREKVYEPAIAGREPQYLRYHAELFDGQQLSFGKGICYKQIKADWRRNPEGGTRSVSRLADVSTRS